MSETERIASVVTALVCGLVLGVHRAWRNWRKRKRSIPPPAIITPGQAELGLQFDLKRRVVILSIEGASSVELDEVMVDDLIIALESTRAPEGATPWGARGAS